MILSSIDKLRETRTRHLGNEESRKKYVKKLEDRLNFAKYINDDLLSTEAQLLDIDFIEKVWDMLILDEKSIPIERDLIFSRFKQLLDLKLS